MLTARPGPAELRRAPHLLYGHVHPGTAYSTGAWLRDVRALADSGALGGARRSSSAAPGFISARWWKAFRKCRTSRPSVRDRWRYELADKGADKLHRILLREDPEAAMTLRPRDGQRIVRALEVLEASGRSILKWQAERGTAADRPRTAREFLVIEPERAELVGRIEARFDRMIEDGALEEVKALTALGLDPASAGHEGDRRARAAGRHRRRDVDGRSDRTRQDCNPPICQAAGNLVPAPARSAMAARSTRQNCLKLSTLQSEFWLRSSG